MRKSALVLAGVLATGFALTATPEAARAQGVSVSFGYGSGWGYSPYAYDDGYYPYAASSYYYGTPAYTTRGVVSYSPYSDYYGGYYGSPYAGTQVVYRTGSSYGYYGSGYYRSGWGYGGGYWLSGKDGKKVKAPMHAKAGKAVKVRYTSLKKAKKAQ